MDKPETPIEHVLMPVQALVGFLIQTRQNAGDLVQEYKEKPLQMRHVKPVRQFVSGTSHGGQKCKHGSYEWIPRS